MAFLSLALAVLAAGGDGQGCRDGGVTVDDVRRPSLEAFPFWKMKGWPGWKLGSARRATMFR
jgi:hypothetical protein